MPGIAPLLPEGFARYRAIEMPLDRNEPFTVVALSQCLCVRLAMATGFAFGCQCVSAIACLGQSVGCKTQADIAVADFVDQLCIL